MRILIIPSWYPTPAKPVLGIFIREQASALAQSHEVRVIYLDVMKRGDKQRPLCCRSTAQGYTEEFLQVRNRLFLWQFAYLWTLFWAVMRLRREFNADVMNCHIAVPAGWAGGILSRLLGLPMALTENSSEFGSILRRPGTRWMARIAVACADLTIAVSEGQRRRFHEAFGHGKRAVVVPNIVDTQRFTPTPLPAHTESYQLLFVGLLDTDQKGLTFLLQALARLPEILGRRVRLDIVGDGALRAAYEQEAKALRLADRVTFHGLLAHNEIAEMLRRSHALALPSLHEAAPLVVIEAMASGRPVVVTRCGGPEYMVDARTGLIVEPGKPQALADAIVELLAHLDRYDPATIAAIAQEHYSYPAVTSALEQVYKEAIEARKRGLMPRFRRGKTARR